MKTSDLAGYALDYYVWHCTPRDQDSVPYAGYSPSSKWEDGGPIIETAKMELRYYPEYGEWCAAFSGHGFYGYFGNTLLIAAMRAYVASRFGDEVPDMQNIKLITTK